MEAPSTQSMSRPARLFFLRVFPVTLVAIGAGALIYGMQERQRAKESVTWPTATGIILESAVTHEIREPNNPKKTQESYFAKVRYNYTVDEKQYTGTRIAFGDHRSDTDTLAQEIVARYPMGKEIKVYYAPDEPQSALLEPGVTGQVYFMPIFGGILCAVGLLWAFIMPRYIPKQPLAQG